MPRCVHLLFAGDPILQEKKKNVLKKELKEGEVGKETTGTVVWPQKIYPQQICLGMQISHPVLTFDRSGSV